MLIVCYKSSGINQMPSFFLRTNVLNIYICKVSNVRAFSCSSYFSVTHLLCYKHLSGIFYFTQVRGINRFTNKWIKLSVSFRITVRTQYKYVLTNRCIMPRMGHSGVIVTSPRSEKHIYIYIYIHEYVYTFKNITFGSS